MTVIKVTRDFLNLIKLVNDGTYQAAFQQSDCRVDLLSAESARQVMSWDLADQLLYMTALLSISDISIHKGKVLKFSVTLCQTDILNQVVAFYGKEVIRTLLDENEADKSWQVTPVLYQALSGYKYLNHIGRNPNPEFILGLLRLYRESMLPDLVMRVDQDTTSLHVAAKLDHNLLIALLKLVPPTRRVEALNTHNKLTGYTVIQVFIESCNDDTNAVHTVLDVLENDEERYAVLKEPAIATLFPSDFRGNKGNNAFHMAAYWGCHEVLFYLIYRFAEPTRLEIMALPGDWRNTVLGVLIENSHVYKCKRIEAVFPDLKGEDLTSKLTSLNLELARKLIALFPDEVRHRVIGNLLTHIVSFFEPNSAEINLIDAILDLIPKENQLAVANRSRYQHHTMANALAVLLWRSQSHDAELQGNYKRLLIKVLNLYPVEERCVAVNKALGHEFLIFVKGDEKKFWCEYLRIQPLEVSSNPYSIFYNSVNGAVAISATTAATTSRIGPIPDGSRGSPQ